MARRYTYDTLEMRRFVTAIGASLTLDELRNAIRFNFPERSLPSRSSLGRYRRYLGIRGTFSNELRNPAIRAYLDHADRRMTIKQWCAEIEQSFPGHPIPNVKAVSRYLSREGKRKPAGRAFSAEAYNLIDANLDSLVIDEICSLLKHVLPQGRQHHRSAVARYRTSLGRKGRIGWWDRHPDVARFIVAERPVMTFDELCNETRRRFPNRDLPSRSAIARWLKALSTDRV